MSYQQIFIAININVMYLYKLFFSSIKTSYINIYISQAKSKPCCSNIFNMTDTRW